MRSKENNDDDNDIYLGLIAPMGCDVKKFTNSLENILKDYNYILEPIKISKFLEDKYKEDKGKIPETPFERKKELIKMGDKLRNENKPDYLAEVAISSIYSLREDKSERNKKTAFLINGFKHYKEIEKIRSLYGSSFFLIGLYSDIPERLNYLNKEEGIAENNAKKLLKLEQDNIKKYGQKVSDSFHKSDVFIPIDNKTRLDRELSRFIDLIFGHPYHTPNKDEYAMFHAYAASLRSADLSRQVGAVIVTSEGEIVAQGANDAPKFGGGQYWSDDYLTGMDQRDYARGYDSNKKRREEIVEEIIKGVSSDSELKEIAGNKIKEVKDIIKREIDDSEFKGITEYGRAVHAEMAALLLMNRLGIQSKGLSLFTTTYPCHNCAKHIISAGIKRVVYVEPYPKSLAKKLHDDAISEDKNEKNKLHFEPFTGVGPRRFFDLFSLTLSSGDEILRSDNGRVIDFNFGRKSALPRIRLNLGSIIEQEHLLSRKLFPTKE